MIRSPPGVNRRWSSASNGRRGNCPRDFSLRMPRALPLPRRSPCQAATPQGAPGAALPATRGRQSAASGQMQSEDSLRLGCRRRKSRATTGQDEGTNRRRRTTRTIGRSALETPNCCTTPWWVWVDSGAIERSPAAAQPGAPSPRPLRRNARLELGLGHRGELRRAGGELLVDPGISQGGRPRRDRFPIGTNLWWAPGGGLCAGARSFLTIRINVS